MTPFRAGAVSLAQAPDADVQVPDAAIQAPDAAIQAPGAAILLTGELIFPAGLDYFQTHTFGFPIFVSTYTEYADTARALTDKVLTIDREGINESEANMYQWLHLDRLLRSYEPELRRHSYLLKVRPDQRWSQPLAVADFLHVESSAADRLYTRSDHSFYAKSGVFYEALGDFYSAMKTAYYDHMDAYFPINYENVLRSRPALLTLYNPKVGQRMFNERCLRTGLACNEFVWPCELVGSQSLSSPEFVEEIIAKLRATDNRALYTRSARYCNQKASYNQHFGSEKMFALHIIKKFPVGKFRLPVFGLLAQFPQQGKVGKPGSKRVLVAEGC